MSENEIKRPGPAPVLPGQMALPYNGYPPFEQSSDTSEQAAEQIKPSTAVLRERVLAYFKVCGAHGSTCDEAEQNLNMLHQTCSARVRELVLLKQLVDTGKRRETRSGRKAAVYVVTALGPEAEQERRQLAAGEHPSQEAGPAEWEDGGHGPPEERT